jgi:hypothetical protein
MMMNVDAVQCGHFFPLANRQLRAEDVTSIGPRQDREEPT